MADATYQPKVYHKQGGDEVVVASGGSINIEPGGKITANGTQAAAPTTALTTLTLADAAGTPDYSIGAVTNTTPYGFANAQDAIDLLYVVKNLQIRVAELQTALDNAGITAYAMSYATRELVAVTTAADGSATVYSGRVTGRLSAVHYVKTDFANGSTFTITDEDTGATLWSESNVDASTSRAPRQATHSTLGAAALYAAGGSAVLDKIALANSRIKIVVANGGNAKTGTFHFVLE